MKAKRILAVGLAAVMTMGMSISAFASDIDYSDVPQFEGWDGTYGFNDNAFHASGEGWLESGAGINETTTNVIVPTTPYFNLGYGQPGLYDFGIDPQRLVSRTGAKKYRNKRYFTDDALDSGVYFINDKTTKNELSLYTYDNKSVKLQGTNIGTEAVQFTVDAKLKYGENFKILPVAPDYTYVSAGVEFQALYEDVKGAWTSYCANHEPVIHEAPGILDFAADLLKANLNPEGNVPYTYQEDNYSYNIFVACGDESKDKITAQAKKQYVNNEQIYYGIEVLRAAYADGAVASANALVNAMDEYKNPTTASLDSKDVGMYLGLNTALGDTDKRDAYYEENAIETAFVSVDANEDKINATAVASETVKGTPGNYIMDYNEGTGEYKLTMRSTEDTQFKAFQTVDFWFRGVSTANDTVGSNEKTVTIPTLEFTWTFSKDVPKAPVEAPKLTAINGNDVPAGFNGEFTIVDCVDGGIALTFDHEVYRVERLNGENWVTVAEDTVREITGNTVTFKQSWIEVMSGDRTFRVVCTEGYSDSEPGYSNSFIIKKSAN